VGAESVKIPAQVMNIFHYGWLKKAEIPNGPCKKTTCQCPQIRVIKKYKVFLSGGNLKPVLVFSINAMSFSGKLLQNSSWGAGVLEANCATKVVVKRLA
jgi:hypothetical protein